MLEHATERIADIEASIKEVETWYNKGGKK